MYLTTVNNCTSSLVLVIFALEFILDDDDNDTFFCLISINIVQPSHQCTTSPLMSHVALTVCPSSPLLVLPQVWPSVQSCAGSSVDRLAGGRFQGQK